MKLVVRIALGLVVVLVLLGVGAMLFVDSLAKQAIERGGSYALGVETRVEKASIGLFSGEFALAGLAVANPPGFAEPDFFTLHATELELPLSTLMQDRITIPSLVLEGITIDLERNPKGTNYGAILDSLKRFEQPKTSPEAPREAEAGGGKAFVLRSLVIRDVRATVNLLPEGGDLTKLSLAIPEIVVEGLGSEMSVAQICALVVKSVVRAALQAGGGQLPDELLADLRGRMSGLEDTAHVRVQQELGKVEAKLQKQADELGPEASKALKEASDKLGGKLDGLFDKNKKDKKKE